MATKVRKQIYLEARQDRLLKREAKARGLSEAAVIRQALDAALPRVTRGGTNPAALDAVLSLARQRAAKGPLSGKREWTREGIYEERLARYGKRVSDRR